MKYTIYTLKQFNKIYSNAYALVIDSTIYDIYNDYENEKGELVTALILNGDFNEGVIEITSDIEKDGVSYNPLTSEFRFINDTNNIVGWFRVLNVSTL